MFAHAAAQWLREDRCPDLGADEVHIWWADLDVAPSHRERFAASLNVHEHRRAARLRFEIHRRRYIGARGWLRQLLGEYLDVAPSDIAFDYGPLGKPALAAADGLPRLQFNASDSQNIGVFAFSWERELGVDVECLPRDVSYAEIAERKFAAPEAAALRAFPPHERERAFLACWTRKEAYGKARGVGIRYPLDSVLLCERMTRSSLTLDDHAPAAGVPWKLVQLQPHAGAVVALVVAGADWQLRCLHRAG